MKNKNKKLNIGIIGAGISGLAAGIYGLENGFNVDVFEKHNIPGGQCTGWTREGVFIDGCAHWIVGTNPKSQLFPLWKKIGAFDENSVIHETEYFKKIDINGTIVTFYADLNLLEAELLKYGPDDKKQIKKFIKGIKAYQHVTIPADKPLDLMNPFDYMVMGLKLLPMARAYFKYTHITIEQFAKKFKSKILQEAFVRIITPEYNMHSLLYIMQALSLFDAGCVEGGSLKLAIRVSKRFKDMGGNLYLSTPVKRIIVENNKAAGIELENGKIKKYDYVISTCDVHHTLYNLLENKYKVKYYEDRFNNRDKFPLSQTLLLSFKVSKDLKDYPKMIDFVTEPFSIGKTVIDRMTIRSHYFDQTLTSKDNCSTMTVLITVTDDVYDIFKSKTKEEYEELKNHIAKEIGDRIKKYTGFTDDEFKYIDMTTPLTYERYCNAYRGSYMSFISTSAHEELMDTGLIKGLDNFIMSGQWIMSPGGLPIALFTGKNAIYRITKKEHLKFKD